VLSSEFIGIRGWTAKIESLLPIHKNNKLSAVVGQLSFFPHRKERHITYGDKEISLDVLFQCYREDVAEEFLKTVKPGEVLIISGDLSDRSWSEFKPEITTNCWVDEFIFDKSRGQCSPIVGELQASDLDEFVAIANTKYDDNCPHCGKEMAYVPYETAKYCIDCST
jgi:hypothetical protein